MRSHHVWIAIAAAAAAAGLAWTLGNDYYLRIFFMMCVYYLCAAGMNVNTPLSGPTKYRSSASIAMAARSLPTPGSTTTRKMVPDGKYL